MTQRQRRRASSDSCAAVRRAGDAVDVETEQLQLEPDCVELGPRTVVRLLAVAQGGGSEVWWRDAGLTADCSAVPTPCGDGVQSLQYNDEDTKRPTRHRYTTQTHHRDHWQCTLRRSLTRVNDLPG